MAYDLLITNGTIVDGSGGARFNGNVAVQDGRIAALGAIRGFGCHSDRRRPARSSAPFRRSPYPTMRRSPGTACCPAPPSTA